LSVVAPRSDESVTRKSGDSRKLGEILAERIEDDITSAGWPVGAVLGSEAELTEKYRVSRAVFREAMRIVDHHGVAEMRRGPGGGLVVTAPDIDAIVRAVSLQLQYERIQPGQVLETRNALELECARLATKRIDEDGRVRIKAFLDAEEQRIKNTRRAGRIRGDLPSHDFHLLLADLTGNPALSLFLQMTTRVLGLQSPKSASLRQTAAEVHRVHAHIADAVIAGDVEAAERRMARHMRSVEGYFSMVARTDRA
jgi:DNA-binding FadR family transcriptional regulator